MQHWQITQTMENWEDSSHLNSNSFRNRLLNRPSVMTKNLQFLLIHDGKKLRVRIRKRFDLSSINQYMSIYVTDHNAILGGTSMTDVFWTGNLWHFNDISNLNREHASRTLEVDTGVCNAVYLNQDKFVVVDDNGAVRIFEICTVDKQRQLQSIAYACQHDNSALTISLFPNKRNIVTAGMDYW